MVVAEESDHRNTALVDITETQARLNKLERQEWWRWGITFVAMLALTAGLIVLTLPLSNQDVFGATGLATAVRALAGLVIVFHLFIVRQQLAISRMRRELSSQLCIIASLEALNHVEPVSPTRSSERRRWPRADFDQQLKITARVNGKATTMYGRIRDIAEHGMGAIIPSSISPKEVVTLEFSTGPSRNLHVQAIVRHRTGFRYGFEFLALTQENQGEIERILAAADRIQLS